MSLVVSILARDLDTVFERARSELQVADILELRLDHIRHVDEDALRARIRSLEKPVLVAVNTADSFGHFTGTTHERLEILRTAARAGAAYIDVDHRIATELGAVTPPCRRIVSRHFTDQTPHDLPTALTQLRSASIPGDLIKLVAHAECAEDGLRMLALLERAHGDLIAFASGTPGTFTRTLAPIFGSPFTYAAPSDPAVSATAPGQVRADRLRAHWPTRGISDTTAIFAVIGNPARHSLSPHVHGALLRAHGIDAVYVAIEPFDFAGFLTLAGDPRWRGCSVTAPFKEEACRAARVQDPASRATRATNTLVRSHDGWNAHNTDAAAVRDALAAHGVRLANSRAVVVGTGGAARAALFALRESGARTTVAGRDTARASALALEFGCDACAITDLGARSFEVLVNCTPAGSLADPDELPVDPAVLHAGMTVLDAVYRPARTPLIAAAERCGCRTLGGGEWFVRQALAQFRLFTGVEPDERVARAAFERALAETTP